MHIVHKINKLRESKSITITDFAYKIGISRDGVYKLTDDSIKVSTLLKACEVLSVPIERFFEKEGNILKEPAVSYGKPGCDEIKAENKIFKQQYEADRETIKGLLAVIDVLKKQIPKPTKNKTHG